MQMPLIGCPRGPSWEGVETGGMARRRVATGRSMGRSQIAVTRRHQATCWAGKPVSSPCGSVRNSIVTIRIVPVPPGSLADQHTQEDWALQVARAGVSRLSRSRAVIGAPNLDPGSEDFLEDLWVDRREATRRICSRRIHFQMRLTFWVTMARPWHHLHYAGPCTRRWTPAGMQAASSAHHHGRRRLQ